MKHFLVILLLPIIAQAQWKEITAIATMGVIAGVADGQREVVVNNPYSYAQKHPDANKYWWNPTFSHLNKYKDHDRNNGEAFPMSTTVLAFTTDKYHLNQMIRQAMFLGQTSVIAVVQVDDYKTHGKFRWKKLLINLAIMQGSYMMAKGLTHKFYQK